MFINKIKSCFSPLIRSNINNTWKRYFIKQNHFTERDHVASSIKLLIKPFLFTVGVCIYMQIEINQLILLTIFKVYWMCLCWCSNLAV